MSEKPDATREIGRAREFDIEGDEHGGVCLAGIFDFGRDTQGFAYRPDLELLRRFLGVFGAKRLRDVTGRKCWVTRTHTAILNLAPLMPDEGQEFDVAEWLRGAEAQSVNP